MINKSFWSGPITWLAKPPGRVGVSPGWIWVLLLKLSPSHFWSQSVWCFERKIWILNIPLWSLTASSSTGGWARLNISPHRPVSKINWSECYLTLLTLTHTVRLTWWARSNWAFNVDHLELSDYAAGFRCWISKGIKASWFSDLEDISSVSSHDVNTFVKFTARWLAHSFIP